MATHIQVVLKDDVDNLGSSGEVVRVRPGYARNFLLPRGLAAVATRSNIAQVEHEKQVATARSAKLRTDAQAVAKRLEGTAIEISMQAGEGDKLFGSVGTKDVADALAKKGHTVDRKKIVMPEAIKTLGEHTVGVKLGYDVTANVKVVVKKAE
jgi:large subunit ribosomal protein L9